MAKTWKAILVGAGGMGKTWAKALHANPRTVIGSWIDIEPGRAAAAAKELDVPVEHTGAVVDHSLGDFLVDVTIPEAHAAVTIAALEAGLPVLGEKPMASSMEEAHRMVAASEATGKLYAVSQNRRYDPYAAGFRDAIGRLGKVQIVNADFYIGAHFGGFRDAMNSPLLLDMAIHHFDLMRYLTGLEAELLFADEFNPDWSWYQGAACATVVFRLSNGGRFVYRGSWCSEGRHTAWNASWRAVGENGTATWDGNHELCVDLVSGRGGFHSEIESSRPEPVELTCGIDGALEDFVAALDGGSAPGSECHDNIRSLKMVFDALEASRNK